ncbi:MAG: hypothetical protein GY925_02565 [Actinomycetia bacterium]|nr:hypothetical protein [Actinomycetes bacterium]
MIIKLHRLGSNPQRSTTAIACVAIALIAAALTVTGSGGPVGAEPLAEVVPASTPTVAADCTTAEPGFTDTSNLGWAEIEGRPVAVCGFDDAALPPIFPKYSIDMQMMFAPAPEMAATWDEVVNDEGTRWRVRRGTPVDFVVTNTLFNSDTLFGGQAWCPEDPDSTIADCDWSEIGVVRTGECSMVVFSTEVKGVDAVHFMTGQIPPDFDWDAIERVAHELTAKNIASVDEADRDGCVRTCEMWGTALDKAGVPVRHAKVEVEVDNTLLGSGSTDGTGKYSVSFACEKSATFDPETDQPHVDLILSDSRTRYDVYGGPIGLNIARFRTDKIPIREGVDRYRRNFWFSSIPAKYREVAGNVPKAQWFEWVEIYQNIAEAWTLADMLGDPLDFGLPLDVVANCAVRHRAACGNQTSDDFAFFIDNGGAPYIGLGHSTSRYSSNDRPDNREYHEFGHFFQADVWDNESLDGGAGSVDHGGIANDNSIWGFVEGFAEWYSTMVQRHVMNDQDAHIYNHGGIAQDLESDITVWDPRFASNAEELAIAGLLLDLEDGPDDYKTNPVRPVVEVVSTTSLPTASTRVQPYEATIANRGQVTTDLLVVTMVLLKDGAEVRRIPSFPTIRRLAPGNETTAQIVVPIAPSLFTWDDFRLEVTEIMMIRAARDDDDIDLTLDEVWTTMRDYRSDIGNRTSYITHLYAAFSAKLGATDVDGNGRPDIDDLFIAHGMYSDVDGRHRYDAGVDAIGRTDTATSSPRFSADHDLPGARLRADGLSPGTEVDVVILPAAPIEHLARVERVTVDSDGFVPLMGPPPNAGGHTTVLANVGGTQVLIADYTAEELAGQIESGVADSVDVSGLVPDLGGSTATGYRMLEADGTVHAFGSATHLGDAGAKVDPGEKTVAMAVTPSGEGYSLLSDDNMVYRFGDAPTLGGSSSFTLLPGERLTTIAISPSGLGTWIFSSHGRVLAFGDAQHFGDLLTLDLQGEIIGSVATPSGNGYYLIGSDGGVFAFGEAEFHGSIQGIVNALVAPGFPATEWLACPIVGLVPTTDGAGYWLVACDGGVFSFGDAPYRGSVPEVLPGVALNRPINGMVAYGGGYLMVASDGGAFNFGAPFFGSLGADPPEDPIVAITPYQG